MAASNNTDAIDNKQRGIEKNVINNPENPKNANNTVQEEITVENIGKYRDVLEKKLDERKTPCYIKYAFLSTIHYINNELDDHYYVENLYYFMKNCKKLNITMLTGEEAKLREEELNTMERLSILGDKGEHYDMGRKNFMTTKDKKQYLLRELLPYLVNSTSKLSD